MARKRDESMDQRSFWTVDAAEAAGKLVSAAHVFIGTRQNGSVWDVPTGSSGECRIKGKLS
jgi:hypothetical protein